VDRKNKKIESYFPFTLRLKSSQWAVTTELFISKVHIPPYLPLISLCALDLSAGPGTWIPELVNFQERVYLFLLFGLQKLDTEVREALEASSARGKKNEKVIVS